MLQGGGSHSAGQTHHLVCPPRTPAMAAAPVVVLVPWLRGTCY